jgi:hypothetical protein
MPTAIHTYTGLVVDVPQHILDSELGRNVYVEVPEGTKPLAIFKPGNADEFRANNRDFSSTEDEDKSEEIEQENEVSDVE